MNKFRLLLLLGSFVWAVQAQTQTNTTISNGEYQNLKESGSLDPLTHYIIDPSTLPSGSNGSNQRTSERGGGGGCACYTPHDGSWTLAMPPNDDGSSDTLAIPFNFCLYGTNYDTLWINNNGNVTFDNPYATFSPVGFPSASYVMVAPFWGDVDTRAGGGEVWYKITPTAVYVNWEDVGYFNQHTDLRNTFSLIITDGNDPVIGVGNNVAFCYQDMQWTTGDASFGSGGFGGFPATVGCNKGNGIDFVQFGQFDSPGTAYFGPYATNNGVSWLDNQSFQFNACNATNIPPTLAGGGLQLCDTLQICEGDTLVQTLTILSPEAGQITTLSGSSGSPDFSVLSINNGNTADITFQVIGNTPGLITINVDASDDGVPPQNVTYVIYVQVNPNTTPDPTIVGDTIICPGENTTLLATGGTYDTYLWSTGGILDSVNVNMAGIYSVEVSLNGCRQYDSITVYAHPNPVPAISGAPGFCFDGSTVLQEINGPYVSYNWSTGSTADTTLATSAGTYYVTVTDTNTCMGMDSITLYLRPDGNIVLPTACENQASSYSFNSTGEPISNYFWEFGTLATNDTSTLANPSYVYSMDGTYSVNVIVTSANGCSDTVSTTINVHPQPSAIVGPPSACIGDTVTFVPTITGDSITNISWTFSGGAPGNSTDLNPVVGFPPVPGNYPITLNLTTEFGCTTVVNQNFQVLQNPVTDFEVYPICISRFTFDPYPSGDSLLILDWYMGDGTSFLGMDTSTFNYLFGAAGTYDVTMVATNEFGCVDSIVHQVVVLDTITIKMPNVLKVNSAVQNNKIDLEVFQPGFNLCIEYTYSVFDRWGVLVFQAHNDPYNPDMFCSGCFRGKTQNGAPLSPGVYYYVMEGTFNVLDKGFIEIVE